MDLLTADPTAFWKRPADRRGCLRREIDDRSMCESLDDHDGIDLGTPRFVTVRDDPGAWRGAQHLVVLLVYEGLVEIGAPGDAVAGGVHNPDPDRAEVRAIARLFGEKYESRLMTRGLVRLAPCRIPSAETMVTSHSWCSRWPAASTRPA